MPKATNKIDKKNQLKLQQQAQMLKSNLSTTAAGVVAYRETSGDYGDMSHQSEQEWLFVNRNKAHSSELSLIENALQRMKDGTYGICAACEQPISRQRLRAVPWAKYCIDCQDNAGRAS
jgi:DnaK suppressor protein